MNRKLCALIACVGLGACAPTVWDRPGTTPQQFTQDNARCQLVARGMNPGDFSASGRPGFVAAAAAVSIISTAIGQAADYRNCMLAQGYMPQAQPTAAPAPAVAGASAPPAAAGVVAAPPPAFVALPGPPPAPATFVAVPGGAPGSYAALPYAIVTPAPPAETPCLTATCQ